MNCEESQTLIEAYFDGELDQNVAMMVSLHIERCLSCSAELKKLTIESRAYQTYERGVDVFPEMWAKVRDGIDEALPDQAPALRATWRERWRKRWQPGFDEVLSLQFSAPVAAVLVLSAIAGTVAVMKYGERTPAPNQVASSSETPSVVKHPEETRLVDHSTISEDTGSTKATQRKKSSVATPRTRTALPAGFSPVNGVNDAARTPSQLVRDAEKNYLSAIAMLTRDVQQRPSQLDSETRAKLDGALASIDRTISATRKAARRNPNDPLAVQYMLTAYAKKVEVLKEMTNY